MMGEREAYIAGMAGVDGRYVDLRELAPEVLYAWEHGFLDAMEAEEGEEPQPESAGYGVGQ